MPKPSIQRSRPLGSLVSTLAVAGIFAILGCDVRTPQTPREGEGGLDLSDLAQGPEDWTTRQVDYGRIPDLDTVRVGDSLQLFVRAKGGEASRWRRKIRWPADEYPVLTWTWLPSHRVDSLRFSRRTAPAAVLSVDVTLASAFGFHKTLRYVWSARRDRGHEYLGDGWHPKVMVLRDTRDSLLPSMEKVDVWADFARLWGFRPRHQALSIAIAVHDPDPARRLTGHFGAIIAHPGKEILP
jgi:hypothetical protein